MCDKIFDFDNKRTRREFFIFLRGLFDIWPRVICPAQNIVSRCFVIVSQSNQNVSGNISVSLLVAEILWLGHL